MPSVLDRGTAKKNIQDVVNLAKNKPYDYTYPMDLDLRPGSRTHDRIRDEVLRRARASRDVMQDRFSGWKEIDRTLTAYIDLDEAEETIETADERKPLSIVIPVSYATLETLLTYWVAAFLEEPYFQYEGVGPEDVLGSIMLEMLVAHQCRRAKVGIDLHTMWRDGFSYGIGATYMGWEKRTCMRTVFEEGTYFSKFRKIIKPSGAVARVQRRVTSYEGSFMRALDPYKILPDPDLPVQDVRNMSFFGWVDRTSLMSLMETERDNSEEYFNVRYLQHIDPKSQYYNEESDTGRYDKHSYSADRADLGGTKPADTIPMFIKIVPKDWKLGDSEYPEVWLFEVAGDAVLIRAQPLGYDHGEIPIAITAPDYDGHSLTPVSRLETIYGMQKAVDWLYQSHMANVRKAINDMIVVDPQIINIHDLANPKPGKIIRTRRSAWGRGVKEGIMQLDVSDVTRGHISDMAYLSDIINKVSGSQDAISGVRRRTSERVSATEAAGTMRSALSRLEKAAKITSLQAHYDIAYQLAWNTRQLMNEDTYVKIIGDWEQVLAEDFDINIQQGRIPVRPKDLDVDFDVRPKDGSVPDGGNIGAWVQTFQTIASNPVLMREFDVVRIFKYIARMSGAKNLNDFVRKGSMEAKVVPDDQALEMQDRGQIAPVGPV